MGKNSDNIKRLSEVSFGVADTITATEEVMSASIDSVKENAENSANTARESDKITRIVSEINDITGQNARSVEEIAAAAQHLYKMADNLNEKLSQFKT